MDSRVSKMQWLKPWVAIQKGASRVYEIELKTELSQSHPLYNLSALAIARMTTSDDVLFYIEKAESPWVVVHLTFLGQEERNPKWPTFRCYDTIETWINTCMRLDYVHFEMIQASRLFDHR